MGQTDCDLWRYLNSRLTQVEFDRLVKLYWNMNIFEFLGYK
jgi:hypothetical protein